MKTHKNSSGRAAGWLQVFGLLCSTALVSFSASADGLVICNHCPSRVNAAITAGNGLVVVADISGVNLSAYEVEYDIELRRWRTLSTPVLPSVNQAFLRNVDLVTAAAAALAGKAKNSVEAKAADTAAAGSGGVIVHLHPDNPGGANEMPFPSAFKGSDAYEIVQNATARQTFGRRLAEAFKGADESSPNWNSIASQLSMAVLTFGELYGAGTITIVVQWRNGTITQYRLTTENIDEAKYENGESRDAQGNKIPDSAISNPATAGSYVGSYYFGELPGGADNLRRWMDSARMYGVPVTGAGGNRASCSWDGVTIKCMAY